MKLAIGQRVAYSVQFLKSIGMSHSDMAHARGTITAIKDLGQTSLASIAWDNGADMPGYAENDLPKYVNVANLAKVGPNRRFANCD